MAAGRATFDILCVINVYGNTYSHSVQNPVSLSSSPHAVSLTIISVGVPRNDVGQGSTGLGGETRAGGEFSGSCDNLRSLSASLN